MHLSSIPIKLTNCRHVFTSYRHGPSLGLTICGYTLQVQPGSFVFALRLQKSTDPPSLTSHQPSIIMFTRILVLGTVLVALVALLFPQQTEVHPPFVKGRNGTALFLVNQEHGVSNVHVATASALLEQYPDIDVHFVSFPKLKKKLQRVSEFAQRKTPSSRGITFHQLKSPAYADVILAAGRSLDDVPHPPGPSGISHLCRDMQLWISPWSAEEHFSIYEEISTFIDEIDPAVVVIDTLFRPGLDITRDKNRQHVVITPNQAVDNFLGDQPYGSMFWKYPS